MADRVQELLKTTRAQLKAGADPEFEAGLRWFFKEPVKPYGVRTPQLRELARLAYAQVKHWPVAERDRFVTDLWKSGMLEEGAIVCHLYRRFAKSCGEREFRMFERWIDRYVRNWSHCDGVSTWLIAASIANRPGLADRLARWTKSKNRWKRRAAAVSLIQEAKQGRNTETILHICDLLRGDTDDMVRKGVGWLLKETYPKRRSEVIRFLDDWRATAPRLTLRLAAEKMTEKDRHWLLKTPLKG